ncbi:hypothetical protein BHE90_011311 [Fusarium euwallaceae]|uniref:Uncharacterized protein n=1 Tax=Fusarium euwallaceae TaxID=1147111 RepID=A0A430LEW9_9HYPO|nr:hypothetical protein BHE90_011311 [Fusarium euwallaceae]
MSNHGLSDAGSLRLCQIDGPGQVNKSPNPQFNKTLRNLTSLLVLKRKPRMDDLEADCESLLNDEIRELEFTLMTENLLLLDTNSSSSVNDADFADTPLGMHIPEETDWLNAPIPDPNDPLLFNFNTLPIQIPDIDYYTLHQNWYPDMMPTLTEDSPSATLNSSSVSEQSPVFSPAYSTSPLSTNFSPREQLLPQSLGPTPTPTHASPPKKKPRKRRAKAEPGSRACDKKRERRKIDRPVPWDMLQTGSSEFTIEPLTTSTPPTRLSAMSSTEETTIPPEGYYVTDCPNLAENNTLSCPYIGCDGFVFRSAEEC